MKIAFTLATANYLAQAKTVADSFLANNQDYNFIIGLVDKINDRFNNREFYPHEILEAETLNVPYFEELYLKYDTFELSNALKPFFAEYICERSSKLEVLIYLDSDIMVFDSMGHVEDLLKRFSVCLTPHVLTTMPKDDKQPDESNFLNAGIYNGGFFAISVLDDGIKFLKWWKEKLRYYCFHNVCNGLYVDQIWLNLVPVFFRNVFIIEHFGYNAAYYNLHERFYSVQNKKVFVNDVYPLIFYHFTGYSIAQPDIISKYQSRFTFDSRPDIRQIYENYLTTMLLNKQDYFSGLSPYYEELRQARIRQESIDNENSKPVSSHAFKDKVLKIARKVKRTLYRN